MINGSLDSNTYRGNSYFDLFFSQGTSPTIFEMTADKDSVNPSGTTPVSTPADLALDPVPLFTQNKNRTNRGDESNTSVRSTAWQNQAVVQEGRIFNRSARAPYVDDTYRADDRYGPKAEYSSEITLRGKKLGEPLLPTDPPAKKVGERILFGDKYYASLTDRNPDSVDALGLDGYWERRAWAEGLRIIVGQRLELGNKFGWTNNDPLYPPNNFSLNARGHELRQWRTLRDNLAAVQSGVVYHDTYNTTTEMFTEGNFPKACLALTAHPGTGPGTGTTITNSTTFGTFPGTTNIKTDFLNGDGTNGWEFAPPAASETAFATAIAANQALGKALRNLANFAGDPYGAFPPKQDKTPTTTAGNTAVPSAGVQVHPYPYLAMWGDFSNLRRVIGLLDGNALYTTSAVAYDNLSIADKTTLHTAACTLGMLAYNLKSQEASYSATTGSANQTNLTALGNKLYDLMDGTVTNKEIGRPTSGTNACTNTTVTGCNELNGAYNPDYYSKFTPEEWIIALGNSGGSTDEVNLAKAMSYGISQNQILRDRIYGFALTPADGYSFLPYGSDLAYNANTGTYTYNGNDYKVYCNPNLFPFTGGGGGLETKKLGLAMALCPSLDKPKYPSLYYLFPKVRHYHDGSVPTGQTVLSVSQLNTDPLKQEPYIYQPYIFSSTPTDDVNDVNNVVYKVLSGTVQEDADDGSNNLDAIKIIPRSRSSTPSQWVLPQTTTITGRPNTIVDNTTSVAVAFLDKGMFNGREMMSVRTLDIDLDLLRSKSVDTADKETWLPYTGIVYAFREDALREDGIARPAATTTWTDCDTALKITSSTCLMNATVSSPVDPPLYPENNISPKPVDFYADPDRRPYGFRLRKGSNLTRSPQSPAPAVPSKYTLQGFTFVSDNPVYIVGDNEAFNLHQDSSNNIIEEFTTSLNDDWGNFYNRTNLDRNFGRAGDRWRPAEIIADAVTILSKNFTLGSIEDGIRASGTSSYRSLNSPAIASTTTPVTYSPASLPWIREDGSASSNAAPVPIKINRNNLLTYCSGTPSTPNAANSCDSSGFSPLTYADGSISTQTYYNFSSGARINTEPKPLITGEDDTRINATIVSGIIPSRVNQSYGGLHNFPRFLENWNGKNLKIAGAFIQLNFSTYATGPWEQDSWEPGQNPRTDDFTIYLKYYNPPNRRWGYDVALQYAPAGPVAKRFVTPSNTRSEFYRELTADDPYVVNLLRALGY
jgi:hypothetical protein